MGQLITYVGAYWSGSSTLVENEKAARYLLQKFYYLYKERLEETIRALPYTDIRLIGLVNQYSIIYKHKKKKLMPKEYPLFKTELEGCFKYHFYDTIIEKLTEIRIDVENDRYYFINYCKKRQYQVSDDFYDCVLQDGEVILSKIAPRFQELLPMDFVKKCHLCILP